MISVITPTCFRPQMFKEMCESLYATTQGYDIEHIVLVDEDEETRKIAGEFDNVVLSFSPNKRGALYCWNHGLMLSKGTVIVPSGDDHLYYPKWLDYALESLETKLNGYGVVGMNDLAYNENQVATQWLFTRDFCKDHMGGIFAPPCYEYLCVDLEWEAKAKMTGHYYRDMRAVIEHRHSAHKKRPYDLYDENKMSGMSDRDMATFLSRKARGFPIEWQSVV